MSHCDPNIPSGSGERFTPAFLPSGQKNSFQNLFLNLSILNFYRITSFFVTPIKCACKIRGSSRLHSLATFAYKTCLSEQTHLVDIFFLYMSKKQIV